MTRRVGGGQTPKSPGSPDEVVGYGMRQQQQTVVSSREVTLDALEAFSHSAFPLGRSSMTASYQHSPPVNAWKVSGSSALSGRASEQGIQKVCVVSSPSFPHTLRDGRESSCFSCH